MPIKKSSLEQKWYYRIAKVFFLWVPPLLVAAVLFLLIYTDMSGISPENIVVLLQQDSPYFIYAAIGLVSYFLILKIIWRGFLYIAFGGLEDDTKKKDSEATQSVNPAAQSVAPFIILAVVFAIAVLSQTGYIKLPKIDLDSGQFNPIESHPYGASCTTSDGKTGLYGTNGDCYTCSGGTAVTNPINNNCSNGIAGVYCCGTANGNNGGNGVDGCIPTGCGSEWRCSGSYYIEGVQIRVTAACFPSGLRPSDLYPGWSGTCRQCP